MCHFIFFAIQVSPMLLPSGFAFPYIIETCIWIVLFSELIHDCALDGWCPFLASIDDGLPEEKIEPSHALFQPATIFPVGPTAHVFSSVMMAHILNGCCPFLVLIGVVWNPLFLKCLCCKQARVCTNLLMLVVNEHSECLSIISGTLTLECKGIALSFQFSYPLVCIL